MAKVQKALATKSSVTTPTKAEKSKKEKPVDPILARVQVREALPRVPALRPRAEVTDASRTLAQGVLRIEFLDGEIAKLNDDKAAVFRSLRLAGYDTKMVRGELRGRRLDPITRQKVEAAGKAYRDAVDAAMSEIQAQEQGAAEQVA